MMRALLLCGVLAGCGSSKPAATTAEPTTTEPTTTDTTTTEPTGSATGAPQTCDLDTPDSCPAGMTCKVPEGSPTRTGTCE